MEDKSRLPDSLRLGPVHLTVQDVERSLRFYQQLLGLNLAGQRESEAWLSPDRRPLIVLHERPSALRKPANTTGLYHYALLLPDRPALGNALRKLLEANYPLQGAADHWVSEAIYLADPDGNGMELYRDRARSEWPHEGGRLQMATDPLDLEGVLAAAGSPEQPALPAGTVVGHVHLHVPDLPVAEGFYRGVLGFETVARYGPQAAFLSAGGYHHHIGLNTWAGVGAPRPPEGAVGLRWFTVVLEGAAELGEVADRMAEAGVEHEVGPGSLDTADPAGNRLRFELAANQEMP